jgi:hypothetical protein
VPVGNAFIMGFYHLPVCLVLRPAPLTR